MTDHPHPPVAGGMQVRQHQDGAPSLSAAMRLTFGCVALVVCLSCACGCSMFNMANFDLSRRIPWIDDDRIEVQMHAGYGRLWARVSAQVYNALSDYERFADAIARR